MNRLKGRERVPGTTNLDTTIRHLTPGPAWDEFTPFLEFPAELRRVVYTTNAVESLNARFRRAVRHIEATSPTSRPP